MPNKLFSDKRGFTLVEMIITVAVSVIIIGAISSMVMYAYKSYHSTDKQSTVLNGVNSVTEAVRELTFNAVEAEVTTVDTQPALEEGFTAIYCINNVVYVDSAPIQSAKGLGLMQLSLDFQVDTDRETEGKYKTVKYSVTALNEDGENAIQPQNLSAFFNSCDKGIEGTSGNCIIIKKSTT